MSIMRTFVILGIFCTLVTIQADADYMNQRLLDAAEKGDVNAVVGCIIDSEIVSADKGCDINTLNEAGFSPLMLASRSGHEHVVKELLGFGANVHVQNRFGETALLLAVGYGEGSADPSRINIIRKLLDAGAYIDDCDIAGNTALSHLLRYVDIETVEPLNTRNVLNAREAQLRKNSIGHRFLHEISGQDIHSCKLLKEKVYKGVVSRGATDIFVPCRAATNTRSKTISTFTRSGYNRVLCSSQNSAFAQQRYRALQFLLRAAKK